MKWETPEYNDIRFGFEVTMYINNKSSSPRKELKGRKALFYCLQDVSMSREDRSPERLLEASMGLTEHMIEQNRRLSGYTVRNYVPYNF